MSQHYSDPTRESDPHALPNIETFQMTAQEQAELLEDEIWDMMKRPEFRLANMNGRVREAMLEALVEQEGLTGGWYWQACFPGCLPDGDPIGPFDTEAEALADAREGVFSSSPDEA
jgi:hypothetical protein